jgi:hypothetical protein
MINADLREASAKYRKRAAAKLTPVQIDEANKLANDWLMSHT